MKKFVELSDLLIMVETDSQKYDCNEQALNITPPTYTSYAMPTWQKIGQHVCSDFSTYILEWPIQLKHFRKIRLMTLWKHSC